MTSAIHLSGSISLSGWQQWALIVICLENLILLPVALMLLFAAIVLFFDLIGAWLKQVFS